MVPDIEKPSGIPETFAEYAELMYDLQVLAFQADLTRVATMMVGREGSLRTYPEIGIAGPAPPAHPPPQQPGVDREGHADQRPSTWSCSPTSSRS